jgi:DNA-binding response OmpR family regulator
VKALIVDDSESGAAALGLLLGAEGWEVSYARGAEQALDALAAAGALGGLPDVVVLDHYLPGPATGMDLLRTLRADPNTRALPVVLLTAAPEVEAEALAHDAHALGARYLAKPADPGVLVAACAAAAKGGAS